MMRRTIGVAAGTALLVIGCGKPAPAADPNAPPTLSQVTPAADDAVDVLDRQVALSGADDAENLVEVGPELPATLPRGFLLDIDSEDEVGSLQAEVPGARSATYTNALNGIAMAALADAVTAIVVAPPAAAIALVTSGVKAEVVPNVWVATNVVSDGRTSVNGTFVVAWVGVGWLCEMRLTSSDGLYNNTKWFNGFVSKDQTVGWWDLFDRDGTLVGVVEWVGAGDGTGEFGIAALTGGSAGDVLLYGYDGSTSAVSYWDASQGTDLYVIVNADRSGVVKNPDLNWNTPSCWAAASATEPYADVPCPTE